jgi:hypothetical protein
MKNELNRIKELLNDGLYPNSKDWTQGSVVERVEWLLSMYQNSHEDVLRLEQDVDDLKAGRYYPAE